MGISGTLISEVSIAVDIKRKPDAIQENQKKREKWDDPPSILRVNLGCQVFCHVIGSAIICNILKEDGISDTAPHQRTSLNVWNDVGGRVLVFRY